MESSSSEESVALTSPSGDSSGPASTRSGAEGEMEANMLLASENLQATFVSDQVQVSAPTSSVLHTTLDQESDPAARPPNPLPSTTANSEANNILRPKV